MDQIYIRFKNDYKSKTSIFKDYLKKDFNIKAFRNADFGGLNNSKTTTAEKDEFSGFNDEEQHNGGGALKTVKRKRKIKVKSRAKPNLAVNSKIKAKAKVKGKTKRHAKSSVKRKNSKF